MKTGSGMLRQLHSKIGAEGDAVAIGNLVMGRLALLEGDVKAAEKYLLLSGQIKAGQAAFWGPNMTLALNSLSFTARKTFCSTSKSAVLSGEKTIRLGSYISGSRRSAMANYLISARTLCIIDPTKRPNRLEASWIRLKEPDTATGPEGFSQLAVSCLYSSRKAFIGSRRERAARGQKARHCRYQCKERGGQRKRPGVAGLHPIKKAGNKAWGSTRSTHADGETQPDQDPYLAKNHTEHARLLGP